MCQGPHTHLCAQPHVPLHRPSAEARLQKAHRKHLPLWEYPRKLRPQVSGAGEPFQAVLPQAPVPNQPLSKMADSLGLGVLNGPQVTVDLGVTTSGQTSSCVPSSSGNPFTSLARTSSPGTEVGSREEDSTMPPQCPPHLLQALPRCLQLNTHWLPGSWCVFLDLLWSSTVFSKWCWPSGGVGSIWPPPFLTVLPPGEQRGYCHSCT